MDPPLHMKCDIREETVPLTYGCKVYVLFPLQYGILSLYNELYSQNSFVRFNANQELCNGQRNLSVISVFALCSDMPVLIDSFRARIVRVATMCN